MRAILLTRPESVDRHSVGQRQGPGHLDHLDGCVVAGLPTVLIRGYSRRAEIRGNVGAPGARGRARPGNRHYNGAPLRGLASSLEDRMRPVEITTLQQRRKRI